MIERSAEKTGNTWFVRCDCSGSTGTILDQPLPVVLCGFCQKMIMIENIKEVRSDNGHRK